MKTQNRGAVDVLLLVVIVGIGAILLPAPTATGPVWYAPKTWFNNKPVKDFEKAKSDADKAKQALDASKDAEEAKTKALLHASHIEVIKARTALESAPNSKPVEVAARTLNNATTGLGKIDSVTSAEMTEILSLVKLLIAEERNMTEAERQRAKEAETKQREAEKNLTVITVELEKTKAQVEIKEKELETQRKNVLVVADKLETSHAEKTGLLNAYEAQNMRHIIMVVVILVILGLLIYCRMCLGGVGRALHAAGAPQEVINNLDAELSKVGQFLIRSGRVESASKSHQTEILKK